MNNPVFGTIDFDCGWKKSGEISLFDSVYPITICADSYFESDAVTKEQEEAYLKYLGEAEGITKKVEKALAEAAGSKEKAKNRFVPAVLAFSRDGGCALLIDERGEEDGFALCLFPEWGIVDLDDFL